MQHVQTLNQRLSTTNANQDTDNTNKLCYISSTPVSPPRFFSPIACPLEVS